MNDKTITLSILGYNIKTKEYEQKQSIMLDFQPSYDDLADVVSMFHAYKLSYSRKDNPARIDVTKCDFGKRVENRVKKDLNKIENDDECYLRYIDDLDENKEGEINDKR